MNTPKISIIVPVYKVEQYLRRCLDSIVAQTFTDWECILIDDGSPDNSGKICDEYAAKDGRFRVFHQENAGVSAARNKGLDEARGEWIAFVDSDDWVEREMMEEVYINSNGAKIIHFGDLQVDDKNSSTTNLPQNKVYENINRFIKSKSYRHTVWSYFIHKNLTKGIRFPIGITNSEDQCFLLQCIGVANKVKCIQSILYCYKNRLSSASKIHKGMEHIRANYDVVISFLKFAVSRNLSAKFVRIGIRHLVYETFIHAFQIGIPPNELKNQYRLFFTDYCKEAKTQYYDYILKLLSLNTSLSFIMIYCVKMIRKMHFIIY